MAEVPVILQEARVLPAMTHQAVSTHGKTELPKRPKGPKLYPLVMSSLSANDLYSRFEESKAYE